MNRLNKRLAYFQDNFVEDPSEEDFDPSQYYYRREQQETPPPPSTAAAATSQAPHSSPPSHSLQHDPLSSSDAGQEQQYSRPQQSSHFQQHARTSSHHQQSDNGPASSTRYPSGFGGSQEHRYPSFLKSQDSTSSSSSGIGGIAVSGASNGTAQHLGGGRTTGNTGNMFNDNMASALRSTIGQQQESYNSFPQPSATNSAQRAGHQRTGMTPVTPTRSAPTMESINALLRSPMQQQQQQIQAPSSVTSTNPNEWPMSLQKYAEKALSVCKTQADRQFTGKYVNEIIAKANRDQTLWSTDWSNMPLPPIPSLRSGEAQQQYQQVLGHPHQLPQQEYRPSETILAMLNGGSAESYPASMMMNQGDGQHYLLQQQQQPQQQTASQIFASKQVGTDNLLPYHHTGMMSLPQHQLHRQMPSTFQPQQQQQQQLSQQNLGSDIQTQMQQQQHQRFYMKQKTQKYALENDRYGLLGLMGVINTADEHQGMLALGYDLTALGLNLNSSESLYTNFCSPWSDRVSRIAPQFKVPDCYISHPHPKDAAYVHKFSKFTEETLFYIFYTMPKDISQIIAAKQLSARGWRYHKDMKMWFMQIPGTQLVQKTATFESGSYMYFDINTWKLERKDGIVLHYEDLLDGI